MSFFMITWGLMCCLQEDFRGNVSLSSYYIGVTDYGHDTTVDVNREHLAEVIFVKLIHSTAIYYGHLPYCPSGKEVTMHSPLLRGRQFSYLLSLQLDINDLELFCTRVAFLLPHSFMYPAFISVWTHGYLFYTLDVIQCYFTYFLVQIVPVSAIGSSFTCFL